MRRIFLLSEDNVMMIHERRMSAQGLHHIKLRWISRQTLTSYSLVLCDNYFCPRKLSRLQTGWRQVSFPWPPKSDRVKVSVRCHESWPGAWERHECCLGSWSRVTWRSRVTECGEMSRGCRDPRPEFSMIHSVPAWVTGSLCRYLLMHNEAMSLFVVIRISLNCK